MYQDVGIADQQKSYKQGRDDSIKQFSIQPHPTNLLASCVHVKKNGVVKEAIVLQ